MLSTNTSKKGGATFACFMANLQQPRYMVTYDVDKMLDLTFTLLWITLPYQTNVWPYTYQISVHKILQI